jgi:hypothetical protein
MLCVYLHGLLFVYLLCVLAWFIVCVLAVCVLAWFVVCVLAVCVLAWFVVCVPAVCVLAWFVLPLRSFKPQQLLNFVWICSIRCVFCRHNNGSCSKRRVVGVWCCSVVYLGLARTVYVHCV